MEKFFLMNLTDEEINLIKKYRQLSKEGKDLYRDSVKMQAELYKKEKEE